MCLYIEIHPKCELTAPVLCQTEELLLTPTSARHLTESMNKVGCYMNVPDQLSFPFRSCLVVCG